MKRPPSTFSQTPPVTLSVRHVASRKPAIEAAGGRYLARRAITLIHPTAIAACKADDQDARVGLALDLHDLGDALVAAADEAGRALDEALTEW